MKDRKIIMSTMLKDKVLKQLYLNHMEIQKTRLLAHESIY